MHSYKYTNLNMFVIRFFDSTDAENEEKLQSMLKGKVEGKYLHHINLTDKLKEFLIDVLELQKIYSFVVLHEYKIINDKFIDDN